MAKAWAILKDRSYVIPEDVQEVFTDVCAHRLILKPQARLEGISEKEILQDILKEDGLIVDELNIEYDPIDILPIYPMQIYFFMFTFNSDPIKLSNGIVIENQITRMLLNNKHYKKIYKDWKEDLIGMGK